MPKSTQFSKNPAMLHARIIKLLNVIRAKQTKTLCANRQTVNKCKPHNSAH